MTTDRSQPTCGCGSAAQQPRDPAAPPPCCPVTGPEAAATAVAPPAPVATLGRSDAPWSDGAVATPVGDVPRVRTTLTARDRLGAFRVRCSVGRMRYRIEPGLYAAGSPGVESPVLVSANYKLSFDHLRRAIEGRDAWILVLDTRGINVWCAAGKGTFGTDELVRRVESCALERIVSHRKLIVPQLGAGGVSAHLVHRRCGFRVIYGPVRAADLPAFLDAGMKARPEMRRVRFALRDRAVLIPVEIMTGAKYFLLAAAAVLLLGGLTHHGYDLESVQTVGLIGAAVVTGAFLASAVLGPTLLPWLPGRAFSAKGAVLGLALLAVLVASAWSALSAALPGLHLAAWALIVPAIASFTVMNFTGATTFTSLSGVLREMRIAVPLQIAGAAIGLALWVAGLFLGGR